MAVVTTEEALDGVNGSHYPHGVTLSNLVYPIVAQGLIVVEHISMGVKNSPKEC